MWLCAQCNTSVDDQLDKCWNCGKERVSLLDDSSKDVDTMEDELTTLDEADIATCIMCGGISFVEGKLAANGTQFIRQLSLPSDIPTNEIGYDVVGKVCLRCGNLQFYVPGLLVGSEPVED